MDKYLSKQAKKCLTLRAKNKDKDMEEPLKQLYSIEQTPWYFGAYLNMVRHNIFLIIRGIGSKLKFDRKLPKEEDKITDSFIVDKKFIENNNPALIYKHLTRYLPFTNYFSSDNRNTVEDTEINFEGIDLEKMTLFTKTALNELKSFRNDYSHYYSAETKDKRKVEVDVKFASMLSDLFGFAVLFAKKRLKGVIPEGSFDFVGSKIAGDLFENRNKITTRGLVFFCCLFLDKENAFHFFNKVTGFKDTRLYDFLATREVFTVLCAKLPHDKLISSDPDQAFQLDILNYLNRAPEALYHALDEKGKKIFQPDLSELSKQKISQNSINPSVPDEFNYENYIRNITLKKRSRDRFPEFALNYLDHSENFLFRFQIELGKSKLESYKKPVLGKLPEEKNRNIIKRIKTFGTLSALQSEEAEEQILKEAEFMKLFLETEKANFTQYAPHYNLRNNKIGMISNTTKNYFGKYYRPIAPEMFLSVHELPKLVLLELLCKGKSSELINTFLEKNKKYILEKNFIEKIKSELQFEQLYRYSPGKNLPEIFPDSNIEEELKKIDKILNSSENKDSQKRPLQEGERKRLQEKKKALKYAKYIDDIEKRKHTLDRILKVYGLNHRQIPEKITDYWLNISKRKTIDTFAERIKTERKECKRRLKDIVKGKIPKTGEMASFLSRDIVGLVIDEKVKDKITSFYYDLLQECLAFYADPERKKLFLDLCRKELSLFDKDTGHPFLSDIDFSKIKTTRDLYEVYIRCKGAKETNAGKRLKTPDDWLYKTFYHVRKNEKTKKNETTIILPENNKRVPLLYSRWSNHTSELDTWLNSIKGRGQKNPKPVDLPTDLFDKALISLLKGKTKTEDSKKYNYSKLLSLWMKDTQPFYNENRNYVIFKDQPYRAMVKFNPQEGKAFKDYYSTALENSFQIRKKDDKRIRKNQIVAVFKGAIDENEKIIRFYQTKDRILLLMLCKLMGKNLQISLSEISPNSDKGPLNETVEMKETILGKTIVTHRKRKDFSLFKRFLYDRRLPDLFKYFDSETIEYDQLKKELEDYERYKEEIFKEAFGMEKSIIEVASREEYGKLVEEGTKKGPNLQHCAYLNWLTSYNLINENDKDFFSELRNKFSHNQFPRKEIIDKFIQTFDLSKTFSSQIASAYLEKLKEIKNLYLSR